MSVIAFRFSVANLVAVGFLSGFLSGSTSADDALSSLSDEFGSSASLAQWSRIHQVEGWNADQLAGAGRGHDRARRPRHASVDEHVVPGLPR